ncbi:hypothetical protein QEN19_000236 [Hanseniaspora menglaensis]
MFRTASTSKLVGQRYFSATPNANGRAIKEIKTYLLKERVHLKPTVVRALPKKKMIKNANEKHQIGQVVMRKTLPKKSEGLPEYLYGESSFYTQSNHGLYGGFFPYTVERETASKGKTRVVRKPHVIGKNLYSATLDEKMYLKLVMKVYQAIQREGGLDTYLIKNKSRRIKELGPKGWELRCKVLIQQDKNLQTYLKGHENIIVDKNGQKHPVFFELGSYKFKVPKKYIINSLYNLEKINDAKFDIKSITDNKIIPMMEKFQLPIQFYTIEQFEVNMDEIEKQLEKATLY